MGTPVSLNCITWTAWSSPYAQRVLGLLGMSTVRLYSNLHTLPPLQQTGVQSQPPKTPSRAPHCCDYGHGLEGQNSLQLFSWNKGLRAWLGFGTGRKGPSATLTHSKLQNCSMMNRQELVTSTLPSFLSTVLLCGFRENFTAVLDDVYSLKKNKKDRLDPNDHSKMSLETLSGIVTKLIGHIITLQNAKVQPRDFVGKK